MKIHLLLKEERNNHPLLLQVTVFIANSILSYDKLIDVSVRITALMHVILTSVITHRFSCSLASTLSSERSFFKVCDLFICEREIRSKCNCVHKGTPDSIKVYG